MPVLESRRPFACALALVTLALVNAGRPAAAQELPLAQVLPDLILRDIVLENSSASTGFPHTAHFQPGINEPNNPVVAIVEGFNNQMATQFATFPLGSSSGGLTYVFDETVGTFRRSSRSFGPLFAERALTIGRRKLNAGFNYQHTSYDRFEGQNLADGSIKFYLRHNDCCGFTDPSTLTGFRSNVGDGTRLNPPFEGDLIEAALSLEATTHTTALFANYGLTNRLDLGVAVPIVRVNLDASVTARVLRIVTNPPPEAMLTEQQRAAALDTHTFQLGNPNATRTIAHHGHATGLGDIAVRTKYQVLRGAGGGVAAALDLRLPTGDEDELLGTGGVQAKFMLVASSEHGRFSQHVNLGYTASSGEVAGSLGGLSSAPVPNEVNYSGGLEFVAHPRVTVIGDVVGRTLRDAGRLDVVSKPFEWNEPTPLLGRTGPGCGGFVGFTCRTLMLPEFAPRAGNLTLMLGTAGAKVNLSGNLLLSGSVLFPLNDAGLRSHVSTIAGLDYAF
jgi:Putative MetA-pathway of phenol degradation